MAEQWKFRELIRPGTNFEFVARRRLWVSISMVVIIGTIVLLFINKKVRGEYLNWNIDFKGGTEMIFGIEAAKPVGAGEVRGALTGGGGFHDVDVSELSWDVKVPGGKTKKANGFLIRTIDFGALPASEQVKDAELFAEKFKDHDILKATFHGDTLHVRAKKPFSEEEVKPFFAGLGLEMKPWGELAQEFATPTEGTGEYNYQLSIFGIDRQYQRALEKGIPGAKVHVEQVYAVGAKAGAQLRNDGLKSIFYAMLLIMLYLAFRFDVRYAPGATIAMLHDAMFVVGFFALFWVEFSLVTVAALLTVIGYSVNDTVIIFDRIRENIGKLKDKKLLRVVNISLNETLSRTLLTVSTVFVTTLMMNIFGTGMVRNFAFAMNVGVIVGTYSSIFIASPIFIFLHNRFFAADDSGPQRGGRLTRRPAHEEPIEEGDEGEPEVEEPK